MIKLFLQPNDVASLTGFSGNIDVDNLKPSINVAQTMHVKRILGKDLYEKIYTDIDTLEDDYLTIFNDYVVYMLAFFSASIYLSLNTTKVTNLGAFKINAENSTAASTNEVNILSKNYEAIATSYENNFYEFMKGISITEYGETEKTKPTNNLIGWY